MTATTRWTCLLAACGIAAAGLLSCSSDDGGTDGGAATSAATSNGEGSDESAGGAPGNCLQTCTEVADCPNQGDGYQCLDGFCIGGGLAGCDAGTCAKTQNGGECLEVFGEMRCVVQCGADMPCNAGTECIGTTDAGLAICDVPPCGGVPEGAPCAVAGLGDFGTCTGGECICTADAQCTADGFACRK